MLHVYCHQVKLCKAPNHQISSKRTTAGANFCARSKTARRAASVSPTHFDRRAGPLTISMCAPHSPATARARRVFHVGVLQRQLDQVACGLDRSVLAEDVGVARGRYATLHGLGAVIGCLVLSGNSSRKLWLKFADFRGSYRTGGARSTPWMKQGCRSDGPAVMVIWARLLRFVVWPPCLGQRTALRHL